MIRCLAVVLALGAGTTYADALEQCRERVVDYAVFWDHADAEGLARLFTEDATLDLAGETFRGPAAIVERMTRREDGSVIRHLMSTIRVTPVDATTARGVSYVSVYISQRRDQALPTVNGFALMGEYHDTFRLQGGECRIAARRLVPVLRHADPAPAGN